MAEDTDLDMNAALAEMSAEIEQDNTGGGDDPPATPAPPPGSAPQPVASPSPSPVVAAPAPPLEPWRTPPKAWKKELHDKYGTLDPAVMQYLHQREDEFVNGVAMYKHPLEEYNKVFDHYKPWFEAHKLKPTDAFTRLANSHIALLGEGVQPEVREKYVQALISDYGLDPVLRKLYGTATPENQIDAQRIEQIIQQRMGPLHQQFNQFLSQQQAAQQAREAEELQAIQGEIDKFVSSPENEFAAELIQDMTQLVQAGLAADLKEAYEKACYLNPSVKAKLIQREIEKAASPPRQPPRNVRSGSEKAASTKPADDEDMDATMARVLKDITSRA